MPALYLSALLWAALPGILFSPGAAAQEGGGSSHYVRTDDGKALIVQRLSWPGDENVSRYELVVEQKEPAGFTEIHREITENNFAELSLRPGSYRYRVLVYNLLSRFEYASNWTSLNIIRAVQPALVLFSPECFYLYEEERWELRLRGRDLAEGAELSLIPAGGSPAPGTAAGTAGREPVRPRSFILDPAGKGAAALFDAGDLRPGLYRITVTNPGGLEASLGPFEIRRVKKFALEAGYAPLVPLHGYLADAFDPASAPLGAYARFSLYPLKRRWRGFGIEGAAFWNRLGDEQNGAELSAQAAACQLDLAYRTRFLHRTLSLCVRAGGGIQYLGAFTIDFGRRETDLSTWMPLLDGGLSLEWNFYRAFHGAAGIEYIHLLSADHPRPGFIRPHLGLGWRF
jgi:hypothetical protein